VPGKAASNGATREAIETQRPERVGTLIMVGGAEDKTGSRAILSEVARRVGDGKLVIATLASEEPEYQWATYSQIFRELGARDVTHLQAETRDELMDDAVLEMLEEATAVFFTGGDQLRITTKLGGTPAYDGIRALYKQRHGLVAGTSAGAAAIGQVMLMSPELEGAEKHRLKQAFMMARGLGLIRDVVIDQHFAQRARIERLLGAIAENPGVLGVGIDEDTAIIVDYRQFTVTGSGAVYVADGSAITYTNVPERAADPTLCLFDVRLHVLCAGTGFDMARRRPCRVGTSDERTQ
jgi:cyanophycinase